MATNGTWTRRPISLEDLTALCDEIAALVRAGVPLETALGQIAEDLPGRLGSVGAELAERLQRGESLADALRSTREPFPDYFPSLVEAGVQSGRLAVALEGMANTGRRLQEVRRSIILAMLYPAFLFYVAYLLFVFFIVRSAAAIGYFYDILGLKRSIITDVAVWIGRLEWYWLLILPLVLLLLGVAWSYRTSQARLLQSHGSGWTFSWLRSARRILTLNRYSSFADVLALLYEQRVPAPTAVRLAAEASGDDYLKNAGEEMARAIERGDSGNELRDVPPILRWLVVGCASLVPSSPDALVRGLRRAAREYRYEAQQQSDWLRIYLPITATLLIGGTITLFFTVTALFPWWRLLHQMADYELMM